MSEIRHNRLTGEWVIIAPERAKRGGNIATPAGRPESPSYVATCPFCLGNEGMTADELYRVSRPDGIWALRSIVNKFSVLSPIGDVGRAICPTGHDQSVNGVGLHEVLVESPRHDLTPALLPVEHVRQILEGYNHRFREFYADRRIRHVIVFKNHGADAGASQQHPHSQIVGTPIIPGQVAERVERARRHYVATGGCLACELIAEEREAACRIVAENAHFIAFVPYAALSPYHLWILPKGHAGCFSELPGERLPALAEILHAVLGKVYGMLADPPFNLVIRSLGPRENHVPHFHWYISIVPRVNKAAGFELGTGMYINPSSPEDRAQALRDFVVPGSA